MITYVNSQNAAKYSILYSEATADLMSHTEDGTPFSEEPGIGAETCLGKIGTDPDCTIIPIAANGFHVVGEEDELPEYTPNEYYIWNNENKKFELSGDSDPKVGRNYYQVPEITSLNEYFSYIIQLTNINKTYTRLPLDEEPFEIDTNTRQIKVPEHFAKNGISVQGDEIAEVVYFKVRKYFDTVDLSKRDILIQWRSAQEKEDGTGMIEGVSVPWNIDIESDPDYIIFGWPISSKITGAAGEITFAVRFYEYKDNSIVYSLSTLDQRVSVKPALDFDILTRLLENDGQGITSDLVFDKNDDLILSRLENSDLIGSSTRAEEPFFWIDLNPKNSPKTPIMDGDKVIGYQTEAYLDPNNDGFTVIPIEAFVYAGSNDGGRISYSWNKLSLDNRPMKVERVTSKYRPVDTTTEERKPNKLYYKLISGEIGTNTAVYGIYDGEAWGPGDDPENPDPEWPVQGVFERVSSAQIDGTGKYEVTVTNRVKSSTNRITSYRLVVNAPVEPEIVEEGNLKPYYHLINDGEDNYEEVLSVTATAADALDWNNQPKSKLTYQWQKKLFGSDDWEDIEGATDASYTIVGSDERIGADVPGKVGDGYYRVVVYNNLNKEQKYKESEITKVTHEASLPEISIVNNILNFSLADAKRAGLGVTAEVNRDGSEALDLEKDQVTYQWYKYGQSEGTTPQEDAAKADNDQYILGVDTLDDIIIEGATQSTYAPGEAMEPGYYYCVVTNNYNGSSTSRISRFFVVAPA